MRWRCGCSGQHSCCWHSLLAVSGYNLLSQCCVLLGVSGRLQCFVAKTCIQFIDQSTGIIIYLIIHLSTLASNLTFHCDDVTWFNSEFCLVHSLSPQIVIGRFLGLVLDFSSRKFSLSFVSVRVCYRENIIMELYLKSIKSLEEQVIKPCNFINTIMRLGGSLTLKYR